MFDYEKDCCDDCLSGLSMAIHFAEQLKAGGEND